MKRILLFIVFMICFAITASSTNAVLIDFDSLAVNSNIDGVNLGGVTITSFSGITLVVSDFGVGYRSPSNAVTNDDPLGITPGNPMTFTFDSVVNYVSFTGGDRGGDTDQFSVDVFDSLHNLITSLTTPIFGGNAIDPLVMVDFYTVSLSWPGIKSMVVRDAINAGIGIDDLEFYPVPEPSTILLLGFGLAGVGLLRRRFKN